MARMVKSIAVVGSAAAAAAGCGVLHQRGATRPTIPYAAPTAKVRATPPHKMSDPLEALVTAQTENRLLVVGLPGGRVRRGVPVAGDPTYVAATAGVVVVVGSGSGTVTLLSRRSLRVIKVFRGFSSPHIPAISPDGRYAYITDDSSGKLTVIALYDDKLTSRVFVGSGAHHLAFSPDEREVWVALSQAAQTLTLLSTITPSGHLDLGHPHVVGYLHPGFLAHDLLFTPGGKQVWITSANTSYVSVFRASSRRPLYRISAGAPPQHLVFAHGYAYITSGYGSSIERVDLYSGRVIRQVPAPYGSFDLDAGGGYIVTASLLRGTLAIYTERLRLLRIVQLAPSTEDVALSAS